jgi:hypothetical protein
MLDRAPVRTTSLSKPLVLTLWVTDDMKYTSGTNAPRTGDRPPVTLLWSKYRGPGVVKFDKAIPPAEPLGTAGNESQGFSGKATTNVQCPGLDVTVENRV